MSELVFMIPIVAIVGGIGAGMLKSHNKHKENMIGHMSVEQMAELGQMSKIADILDQRSNVLERILDDEVPNWRDNQSPRSSKDGESRDKSI